jgi:hypothetical protein
MDTAEPLDATQPSPPIGSLGRELVRVYERGQTISLVVGFVVGLTGPVLALLAVSNGIANPDTAIPWLWVAAMICAASMLAGAAIAAFLPIFFLGPRDRQASAVHAWVGAREVRRLLGSSMQAMSIPTTPEEANDWLARTPDTPQLLPLRLEMLLLTRRLDEARRAVDRYPRNTPLDEFRAYEAKAMVDEQQSGNADLSYAREAIARIPDRMDRAEAQASLAVLEARRLIGSTRGDWREPLIRARPSIPGTDHAVLARDMSMPIFRFLLPRVVFPVVAFVILVALAVTFMALA